MVKTYALKYGQNICFEKNSLRLFYGEIVDIFSDGCVSRTYSSTQRNGANGIAKNRDLRI